MNAAQTDRPLQMTEVNYAEAKYILIRKDGPQAWEVAARILVGLPIEFHPADRALADGAAQFKAHHKFSHVNDRAGSLPPATEEIFCR